MKKQALPACVLLICFAVLPALAQRSSPFDPPEEKDTTFITDSGPGLDTGCTYRSGGPLVIEVKIDRYVGEVDGNGHLLNVDELIANNVVSPKATIRLPAWDIDLYGGGGVYQPEHDRIFFNGEDLGLLTGDNGIWKMNEFEVDISKLKFPSRSGNGRPAEVVNEIRINIDESNSEEVWCMAVDWVEISFEAMAPILLVHGTNAQSDSWEPDFTGSLAARHIPHSNDINMVANGTSDANARILRTRVNALANSFGADSVHLVGHSKGGLDSRRFIGTYYTPDADGEAEVLSLYTITTPHHGTMLSDLSVANRTFNDPQSNDADVQEYLDSDWWANAFGQGPQEPALGQQTTTNMTGWNAANPWPGGVNFYTISADADVNGDGDINDAEAAPLIPDIWGVIDASEVGTLMYHILGNVTSITVTRHTNFFGLNEWHVITPTHAAQFMPNDLVVTQPSSRHSGASELLSDNNNHSSVKNDNTAQQILNRINADFPLQ